jgi:hypothetical protein
MLRRNVLVRRRGMKPINSHGFSHAQFDTARLVDIYIYASHDLSLVDFVVTPLSTPAVHQVRQGIETTAPHLLLRMIRHGERLGATGVRSVLQEQAKGPTLLPAALA